MGIFINDSSGELIHGKVKILDMLCYNHIYSAILLCTLEI